MRRAPPKISSTTIGLAGALSRSGEWLMRLGVPLRPTVDAMKAERLPGECMVCGRALPTKVRTGPAALICNSKKGSPCRRAHESAHINDRVARGWKVYWALLGTLSVAMQLRAVERSGGVTP